MGVALSDEELDQFANNLRRGETREARAWLESKKSTPSETKFEEGFLLALQGMVIGLENTQYPSLMKRVLDAGSSEAVQRVLGEFKSRIEQKFRPQFELGFDTAWIQILNKILQS